MAEQTMRDKYFELLKAYVGHPAEEYLAAAADLGRELVLADVPPEDIAEIHEEALGRLAREHPDITLLDTGRLISAPLMELLMAYGLAFRAREKALKQYSEHLEEMVEERTRELRAAQERLVRREKLAVLGQLAGGVAHELRNPLGVISNAIYFLQMTLPDASETTREYLDIVSSEVRGAEKIVSDLLNLSRTRTAEKEKIAVSALVSRMLEKRPPPEDVEVTTQIPSDLPPVFVDPRQMRQVLGNLVTNAYQAMPDGGRLMIHVSEDEGIGRHRDTGTGRPEDDLPITPSPCLRVSISDTGCGIPEENLEKIFEPLFTTRAKGIGLGLVLARKLVEGHGGTIEVQSEEGQGSTFTVRLPLAD